MGLGWVAASSLLYANFMFLDLIFPEVDKNCGEMNLFGSPFSLVLLVLNL